MKTEIMCYNEDCQEDGHYDNVYYHPNTMIIQVDCDPCVINEMIADMDYLSQNEMVIKYPINNFEEVYNALLDYEFFDVIQE